MNSRSIGLTIVLLSCALSGCADQASEMPLAVAEEVTPAAFNSEGAPTVEFSVPDMMCPEGCGVKMREILSEQPGARDVLIDFDHKMAVVAVDESKFNADDALASLIDHGFDHSTLKGSETAAVATGEQPYDELKAPADEAVVQ